MADENTWHMRAGERIRRVELHDRYGGTRQKGISPARSSPHVFVFYDSSSGHQHGYFDRWDGHVLLYTGEGQEGDQSMTGGNAAILNHQKEGRSLRVFKGTGGMVQYLGEFVLDDPKWFESSAPAAGEGPYRKVIVFRLRAQSHEVGSLVELERCERDYKRANETPETNLGDPFSRDPNQVDRGLVAHATIQNALHDFLKSKKIDSWSPAENEVEYDLGWEHQGVRFVAEVKSLPSSGESKQLRLGLGQVLDYANTLLTCHPSVRPVLAVERQPEDRWICLCERHGVSLVWPEIFEELL